MVAEGGAQAAPPVSQALLEGSDDPTMEAPELPSRQAAGRSPRVDARPEQRLVRVEVAQAGDGPLVQQHRLDWRGAVPHPTL